MTRPKWVTIKFLKMGLEYTLVHNKVKNENIKFELRKIIENNQMIE